MPSFIKTQKDDAVWNKCKSIVRNQYPDISEDSDNFWKITNAVYHKIRKGSSIQKVAFDEFSLPGQPLRGMDQFTDFTTPVSQQTKDYANGKAYIHDAKYKKINKALSDINRQYPSLSAEFAVDPKYKKKPEHELVNPFYYFWKSRQPVDWGDKFGRVKFSGDPAEVRTDIIYNQGSNGGASTGRARTREDIRRSQIALTNAKQQTRKMGWLNISPKSPYHIPHRLVSNRNFYIPSPLYTYNTKTGMDAAREEPGQWMYAVNKAMNGDPTVAEYDLMQDMVSDPKNKGKLKRHRSFSYGNERSPGELSFSALVDWRTRATLLHEGVPGIGHKDTVTPGWNTYTIYPSGLAHDAAVNAGWEWQKKNTDKVTAVRRDYPPNYSTYRYHDPSYPESTYNYYSSHNELNGLNNRLQLLLGRFGYDTDRFSLTPEDEKSPSQAGEYWDALSAMERAGLIFKHPKTGYYGVIDSNSYGKNSQIRRTDLVTHSNLYSWVAHVNRLKYLNNLIRSGKANAAEREEFKRVLSNMQDSYKQ